VPRLRKRGRLSPLRYTLSRRGARLQIGKLQFLYAFLYVLLTVYLSIILVINQLDAQNLVLYLSLLGASTCCVGNAVSMVNVGINLLAPELFF